MCNSSLFFTTSTTTTTTTYTPLSIPSKQTNFPRVQMRIPIALILVWEANWLNRVGIVKWDG